MKPVNLPCPACNGGVRCKMCNGTGRVKIIDGVVYPAKRGLK